MVDGSAIKSADVGRKNRLSIRQEKDIRRSVFCSPKGYEASRTLVEVGSVIDQLVDQLPVKESAEGSNPSNDKKCKVVLGVV